MFRTLGYFDGMNFAARARASALFSAGLMDDVCPPSTIFAAYNHYAGPKQMRVWPFNVHEGGGALQLTEQIAFLHSAWDAVGAAVAPGLTRPDMLALRDRLRGSLPAMRDLDRPVRHRWPSSPRPCLPRMIRPKARFIDEVDGSPHLGPGSARVRLARMRPRPLRGGADGLPSASRHADSVGRWQLDAALMPAPPVQS